MTTEDTWGKDWSPATPEHHAKVKAGALEPARRILAAIAALPEHVRPGVCWALISDDTVTLSAIGDSLLERDPEVALSHRLWGSVFLADAQDVAEALSDADEPWRTIKAAIEETVENYRRLSGLPTGREFREARGIVWNRSPGDRGTRKRMR